MKTKEKEKSLAKIQLKRRKNSQKEKKKKREEGRGEFCMCVLREENNELLCYMWLLLLLFLLPVDGEFLADSLRILSNDSTELVIRDLSVLVQISLDDSLVHNLLQLNIIKVSPHHHLQNLEQLSVADKSIAVNIIDLEGNCGKKQNKMNDEMIGRCFSRTNNEVWRPESPCRKGWRECRRTQRIGFLHLCSCQRC